MLPSPWSVREMMLQDRAKNQSDCEISYFAHLEKYKDRNQSSLKELIG